MISPTPWHYEDQTEKTGVRDLVLSFPAVVDANGETICRASGGNEDDFRLMADAPRLRAELVQARELLRRWAGPFPQSGLIRDTKDFLNREPNHD